MYVLHPVGNIWRSQLGQQKQHVDSVVIIFLLYISWLAILSFSANDIKEIELSLGKFRLQ